MITLSVLRQTVIGLNEAELQDWIARRWVRPLEPVAEEPVFEDIDVARIRLIQTLRHDLALDAGALPVVLSLLDQLHATRRALAALTTPAHPAGTPPPS